MARYVIGDVQGCFDQLQQLLNLIQFDPTQDQLWFCGDLIARGPKSLETLRFVKNLGAAAVTVLGNHDLNFLASLHGYGRVSPADQLDELLQAPDLAELADWLQQQPLIHFDETEQLLLVHAGLAPEWSIDTALKACHAVEQQLRTDPVSLYAQMYSNNPDLWSDANSTFEKYRFTINSCSRMRYCFADGRLELRQKGELSDNPLLTPWFDFWSDREHPTIFFGHWAALQGYSPVSGIHALDTGCVWGQALTCYCIESQQRFSVAGYEKRL
jgi:bis(5'-nucleosyl)-tetraphosphatase (symmetrical)